MNTPRDADELFNPDAKQPDGTEKFLEKPVNASDRKQLKSQAVRDKSKALKDENDIRAVLSTQEGIRFIARVIVHCGWNQPYFNPSNSWMCETAGRRSIAWQLEQWISDTDLNLWIAVRRELESWRPKPESEEKSARR